MPLLLLLAVVCLQSVGWASDDLTPSELHDRGFAELENEAPEQAEELYRSLAEALPDEPLGHANLAIALLRQQKYEAAAEAIGRALALAPERPDLLAIQAEVLQWTGDLDGSFAVLARASEAAGDDLEILWATYQAALTTATPEAEAVADRTLRRLAELRPENLVVLLQLGQRAIAAGDRTTATGAFGRVKELLWQVQPITHRALGMVTAALEEEDVSQARVPAVRLENVLKVSAMFRESLRELKTGIQGIPVRDLLSEPEATDFGPPADTRFVAHSLAAEPSPGGLAVGDFDGDGRGDLARLRTDGKLEVRLAGRAWAPALQPSGGDGESDGKSAGNGDAWLDRLLAVDIDNDGILDLVAAGPERMAAWHGSGDGTFRPADQQLGLGQAGARGLEAIDFDIEGDLDLALVGGASGPADLWRNSLQGSLERVGTLSLPRLPDGQSESIFASDLDRDGDLDLLLAHGRGLQWLDNLRQGRFVDRSARAGLVPSGGLRSAIAADLDHDGHPDLVAAGRGLHLWRNLGGRFETWRPSAWPSDEDVAEGDLRRVVSFDADNDGRLDLAAVGPTALAILQQTADGGFRRLPIDSAPSGALAVAPLDVDGDGDLDLVTTGSAGLHWLESRGGEENHWLALRLRGLDKGSSKNNARGVGSVVEVRVGNAYQYFEARGDVVHVGLGERETADVVRVVWTNGVPQNRIDLEGDQVVVEEQLLKGSCPFLYAWDGERFAFVTDLLWGAPIGLPAAPGVWVSSDPSELVRIDGLVIDQGRYRLRITEELWEAAFFDHLSLWVVDHPREVEVASSLRIVPGEATPERVLASRDLRPVARAWDGRGADVTERVAARDEVYADGYEPSPYQGVAEPWTFGFDLGEAPEGPVRLHLDGWIFPSDASLNLALAQRRDYPYLPPRLEVRTAEGWQTLVESMGFPAGKTKTMVVDLPPLPAGARQLRMVTSLWLHWDRLAWTLAPADDQATVVDRLAPEQADLAFRGFSALVREAPNAPHSFDYHRARLDSPWLPFPGRYTRYGDVRPLLETVDDFSVVLAAGDEMVLEFDASHLAPPAPGHVRTLFLESHGWDKDADRNTGEGHRLEPLPFHAMRSYPYAEGESYPDTPEHRRYRAEWLTREIQSARPNEPSAPTGPRRR